MTVETTVNRHRGVILLAIGGFLVFLYVRHKRQQQAAAAADVAAAAAAAAQDPGTMDQNTYNKQFSQPAPAYLGAPFSGYGANVTYPPPTQLQPGTGPTSPTPPITFPNPGASSGDSTVGAATGGGAPDTGGTGQGFPLNPVDPIYPQRSPSTPPPGVNPQQWADELAGQSHLFATSKFEAPITPAGLPDTSGITYVVPPGSTIGSITGYDHPAVGTGLYTGAQGEPGTPEYQGIGWVPPEYRPK